MEFYLFNYFTPGEYRHTNTAQIGQNLLVQMGCTACHIPNLVITRDHRIAEVRNFYADMKRHDLGRRSTNATTTARSRHSS